MFSLFTAPTEVLKQTCDQFLDYTASIPLKVAIGTYNVNGGKHFRSLAYKHLSLDDWLLDSKKNARESCKFMDKTDFDFFSFCDEKPFYFYLLRRK